MSNVGIPQCSSGGESGWTLYLDDEDEVDSSGPVQLFRGVPRAVGYGPAGKSWNWKDEDANDESLSMVSDASSGPPYYEIEDWSCHLNRGGGFAADSGRKSGMDKNTTRLQADAGGRHPHYEDTASSQYQKKNSKVPNIYSPEKHALYNFSRSYSIPNLQTKRENEKKHYYGLQPPAADEKSTSKKENQSGKR
ncbi:hypothetical protein SAY86_003867 [Trapa natans]|uniref:Uncharacterized protein n=1 Tax=Trapa natans TaxID=22666 RepID=A0AAN7RIB5_TRANT|nr:hypothetical protein SAY86_003867 [Trapa natans]